LDLSKVGLLSNSELAVMLKPDLHLIDWTRAKKKCSKFQEILSSYGIKPVYTTDRSRKSNGVIEQVNFTMGDMLRTMTFSGSDWFSDMQYTLDAVAWAVCTAVNLNIKHSPCHLAFNHDMIFCHAVNVSWDMIIHDKHQTSIKYEGSTFIIYLFQ
jgi:hypothetical protein